MYEHNKWRRVARVIIQVGVCWGFSLLGDLLARSLHVPLPGSLIGMLIVFVLLCSRILPLRWIDEGADWLLLVLVYLFVPPTVGVIEFGPLLGHIGLPLTLAIVASTVLTLTVSAKVTNTWLCHREKKVNL